MRPEPDPMFFSMRRVTLCDGKNTCTRAKWITERLQTHVLQLTSEAIGPSAGIADPHPGLASVGAPARGPYVVDKGFEGQANQRAWWRGYGAQVICPPKRNSKTPWPKRLRRWLAGVRQIVETVYEKLHHPFRLDRERPHDLSGLQARVAAKMALHNYPQC